MINTNGKFDELREGNYQLIVRDSTGKETKYEKTISLIKQGDCTSSVLAPNSKDGLQAIFIPETGTANILNRDGTVIKKLTIPAEWDGRDSNGNDVQMGDYYLFINDQQSKVITVIR
jgi:flagellar hook assembly protein FlgD